MRSLSNVRVWLVPVWPVSNDVWAENQGDVLGSGNVGKTWWTHRQNWLWETRGGKGVFKGPRNGFRGYRWIHWEHGDQREHLLLCSWHRFNLLASQRYLKFLWAVRTVKGCLELSNQCLHYSKASLIASSSQLPMSSFISVWVSFLEKSYMDGVQLESSSAEKALVLLFWWRHPLQQRKVSQNWNEQGAVKAFLKVFMAWATVEFHDRVLGLFLRRLVNGLVMALTVSWKGFCTFPVLFFAYLSH